MLSTFFFFLNIAERSSNAVSSDLFAESNRTDIAVNLQDNNLLTNGEGP